MQGVFRRASKRTPRHTPREWQKPRRTSRPEGQRGQFILSLTNCFSQLPETELASEVHSNIGVERTAPSPEKPHLQRPRRPRNQRASPRVAKTEHAGEVRVFNTLPLEERKELASHTGEPGTLADESSILFDGVIELTGHVRDQAIQEIFVISSPEEDAILGMPFLKQHGCRIDFSKSAVLMAEKELTCVDKSDRPLVGTVQAVRKCTIPGRSRATIHCRVNDSQLSGLGVVEGAHTRILLASSLNRLTDRGEILVQCVNPFPEAVTIPSGSTLGHFHSMQEKDIGRWEMRWKVPTRAHS